MLRVEGLAKSFTLHLQGGLHLSVLDGVSFTVAVGECVALAGPSGAGKSTLLRCLYRNYLAEAGRVLVRHRGDWVDLARADPRRVLEVRRETLGYVSQFLRAVPRVGAVDLVAEAAPDRSRERAAALLSRLNVPARLHGLPPATFSGGEQQRVNLARGFIGAHPVLLLDEPTASLDPGNREVVVGLIKEAKARGAAVVGIFHDQAVRDAVANRLLPVLPWEGAAAC